MEAHIGTLIFVILALCFAWIRYRAERELEREKLNAAKRPTDTAALMAAFKALADRIETAARKNKAPEPLPGMQTKPAAKRRKESAR